MFEKIVNWATNLGLGALSKFIPAVLILVVGIIVIRLVTAIVQKALNKSKLDKAGHGMIRNLVRIVLYLVVGLMCASALGIDVSSVLALASVATLAVSLALQDLLSNLVGGFTLLYTDPFSAGDYVEIAGQSGTVKEVGMTYTKLLTPDNKLTQIPNSSVVSSEIINYSVTGTRRVDVTISASYETPVDDVLAALKEAVPGDLILQKEGITTLISKYGESSIEYVVRVWCETDKYWDVFNGITYNIKKVFDEKKINMTYPHLNVHLDK